ncbi:MAG: MoxR family ATPase [Pseudobutyrivibrio sp.]|nr:MoxR family ATPase [Pseudobutyrivibrio sp.]
MENKSTISSEDFQYSQEVIKKISDYYKQKVVGQSLLAQTLISGIIADGHILIESVPGLAKTTAAKAISDAVDGKFSRIQCTPDLMPSDITGSQIYHQETGKFETVFGPVFSNFVLLDEVNRSSAKTQAAMLEAMAERQVTIGGNSYKMPQDVFIVIATQNPIEQEGTYPLSEAQTDRFMLKEVITYPTAEEEVQVLTMTEKKAFSKTPAVLTIEDVDKVQRIAEQVYVSDALKKYIADIITATRNADKVLPAELKGYVRIGASPRGSIAFLSVSKAIALINGRDYVVPDDIKMISHQVLRHRIGLSYAAFSEGISVESIIDALVNTVQVP